MASDPHESAVKHVCGSAPYIDDFVDSGYRHIAIGGSSIACGNITSMDLTDVASSEGVVDVITVADIPGHYDIGPAFPGDPLLTSDQIEFYGQAVFAVLAETQMLARQAVLRQKLNIPKRHRYLIFKRQLIKSSMSDRHTECSVATRCLH